MTSQQPPTLSLVDIGKAYGAVDVLSDVNLDVEQGEFVSLLGPSGCGKSTLLGIIAGTITPSHGQVRLTGQAVDGLPPYGRDLGMVFQDYALFPHLSVFENIAFGIRMRQPGTSREAITARVAEMLDLVRLPGLDKRLPAQLSGGQQQRVAIARALAPSPALLLMDEPLSNLDAKVRESTRAELKAIQKKTGITTIYVTHDQEEAMALSDRVVVMRAGRLEQVGTPSDVYLRPASRFVADFVGRANIIEGRFEPAGDDRMLFISSTGVRLHGSMPAAPPDSFDSAVIRPEQISIGTPTNATHNVIEGRVAALQFTGPLTLLDCDVGTQRLSVLATNTSARGTPQLGDALTLHFAPEMLHALPRE
jgi:ABC-type Fe3+/spermidine/putrescine transport system ATPase subunit